MNRERDPTVGAQYRWSARFAQQSPEFWGFLQGKKCSLNHDIGRLRDSGNTIV